MIQRCWVFFKTKPIYIMKICIFKESKSVYQLKNPSAVSTESTRLETKGKWLQAQSKERTELAASVPRVWERHRSRHLHGFCFFFLVIFSPVIPWTWITNSPYMLQNSCNHFLQFPRWIQSHFDVVLKYEVFPTFTTNVTVVNIVFCSQHSSGAFPHLAFVCGYFDPDILLVRLPFVCWHVPVILQWLQFVSVPCWMP
jgi:hypothetical protein